MRPSLCAFLIVIASLPTRCFAVSTGLQTVLDRAAVEEAAGKIEEAVAILKGGQGEVKTAEDRIELTDRICLLYAIMGELDQSRGIMKRMASQVASPEAYLATARFYLNYDPTDANGGVKMLREALNRLPDNVELMLELGRARTLAGNFIAASELYQQVIKRHPKEFRAHYGMAYMYMAQDEFPHAIESIKRALEAGPEVPENYHQMGRVHERNVTVGGHLRQAIWWYQKALDLEARDRYVGALAFARIRAGDITAATALVKGFARKNPDHSLVRWIQGIWLEQEMKLPQAFQSQLDAVKTDGGNLYAHLALAFFYLGVGNRGYAFAGSPGAESWHYKMFRDTDRGANEMAIIRSIDPTFPALSEVNKYLSAAWAPMPEPESEEQQVQMKKVVSYFKKLNMVR